MKNYLLKSVILIMLFAISGCSSSSDDSPAACIPIVCQNGGTSTADCGCNCPDGYQGANCATQKIVTRINISKIRVTKFPNRDTSNNYWDGSLPDYSPDIYVELYVDNSGTAYPVYSNPNSYVSNVISDNIHYWDFIPTTPIHIEEVLNDYAIQLGDNDTHDSVPTANEQMGYVWFNPTDMSFGLPSTLYISNGNYSFELSVTYEF
jgi:hypothetical protein